ncbi:UPF0481 protein At3g47200-like [Telopea speciosissima]|uniref:UPF0481 protein At3g47200-like n=1 Tax=Telopea speciosissima TaxID=54955 RepID=UPI001CC3BE76|nr:UPF0481 protein At3g47200-like [Telopea speciosissima]
MAHVTYTGRGHNNSADLELITSASDDTVGEDTSMEGYSNSGKANRDAVSLLMESIQKDLKDVPTLSPNCSIFRVHTPVRKVKPEAYTPRMVSIGPFHRSDKQLQPMEAQKLRYLNDFLSRESQATLGDYVKAMTELEDRARRCYSEIIQVKSENEFVKMMLIDGCFILELILRTNYEPIRREDPILNATWVSHIIKCDLILLENQLPFFVLERLYNLNTGNSQYSNSPIGTLISNFFQDFLPHEGSPQPQSNNISGRSRLRCFSEVPKNVFDFIISVVTIRRLVKKDQVEGVVKPLLEEEEATIKDEDTPAAVEEPKHLLDSVRDLLLKSFSGTQMSPGAFRRTHSATELKEASVKFEREPNTCLFNITFTNGVLKIPTMKIEDWTESLLRNLIAFEQYRDGNNYITDYAAFIDGLINSPKDVELLEKKGIIESLLGEPKEVAALFNGLLKEVTIMIDQYYFSSVCHDLDKYYKIPKHKWKASLMRDYCNTPWAFISFLAALFLLILTVVQTIFSILQVTM